MVCCLVILLHELVLLRKSVAILSFSRYRRLLSKFSLVLSATQTNRPWCFFIMWKGGMFTPGLKYIRILSMWGFAFDTEYIFSNLPLSSLLYYTYNVIFLYLKLHLSLLPSGCFLPSFSRFILLSKYSIIYLPLHAGIYSSSNAYVP